MNTHECFTRVIPVYLKGEWVTVEVDVVIDKDKLARCLGTKAIKNSSKKSALQVGIVATARRK